MVFVKQISIADINSIILLLFTLGGGIFAYRKWDKAFAIKRSEYIYELIEKIRTDKDISKVLHWIEYDYTWYNESFHDDFKTERRVDKTLSYFSYICFLKEEKLIKKSDFKFFEYEVNRIINNKQVIEYMYNIYHFSKKFNTPITFYFLFEYATKNNILEEDFFNEKSSSFPHYLNF